MVIKWWIVGLAGLTLLAAILIVYFVVFKKNDDNEALKSLLNNTASLRVSALLMRYPNELQEFADNTDLCGDSVDGLSDSSKLFLSTGNTYRTMQISAYEDSAVTATSSMDWSTAVSEYQKGSFSVASDDQVLAAMNSTNDSSRIAMLRVEDLSQFFFSPRIDTTLSTRSHTFVGPTIGVFNEAYRVFWLTDSDGLRYIAASADGTRLENETRLFEDQPVAYCHNGTSRVLVTVTNGNQLNEYRFDTVTSTYQLVDTFYTDVADTVFNITISEDSTRLVVAFNNDTKGSFVVLHRAHVDDPWLRSSTTVSTRTSGDTDSNYFGSVIRIFASEYLLVGGSVETDLEVWYMDTVTGTPQYFYTLSTSGYVPSRRSFISPVTDADNRVWIATGTSKELRDDTVVDGVMSVTYADVAEQLIEIGGTDGIVPETVGVEVTCDSQQWSLTSDDTTFVSAPYERDDPHQDVFVNMLSACMVGDTTVLTSSRYIVQLDTATGEVLYSGTGHPMNTPFNIPPDTTFRMTLDQGVTRELSQAPGGLLVIYQNITYNGGEAHPEFRAYTKNDIGGDHVYAFEIDNLDSYVLTTGASSIGPWIVTSQSFTQYDKTGKTVQSIPGVWSAASNTGSTLEAVAMSGKSSYVVSLYTLQGGSWSEMTSIDTGAFSATMVLSLDALTVVCGNKIDDPWRSYGRSSASSTALVEKQESPNRDYSRNDYEANFQRSPSRRAEHAFNRATYTRASHTLETAGNPYNLFERHHMVSDGRVLYSISNFAIFKNGRDGWDVRRAVVQCD